MQLRMSWNLLLLQAGLEIVNLQSLPSKAEMVGLQACTTKSGF
jgi:hypothetical protein